MHKKILFILVGASLIFLLLYFAPWISKSRSFLASEFGSSKIPTRREYPTDDSINPCHDFYGHACTKVIHSFQLRPDRSRHVFSFSDAQERLLEVKKNYFRELLSKSPTSSMEGDLKKYYVACMDVEARKREELAFVAYIGQVLGAINSREALIDLVAANVARAGMLSFVTLSASVANQERPAFNDIFFDTDLMSLPEKSYYSNQGLVQDLQKLMEEFFLTIGSDQPKLRAQFVIDFEKNLSQIYPTPSEYQEKIFGKAVAIAREQLIKKYPQLRLEKIFASIPAHTVIRDVVGDEVFKFLNEKLEKASLEELKSIYLYFQLSPLLDDAYPQFFDKRFEFNRKYFGGPMKRSARDERCAKVTMEAFAKEVDYILLPKVFPNFPRERFIKSIEKIRAALLQQLEQNHWLTAVAKQEALRKIAQAKLALVSPNDVAEWNFNPLGNYVADAPLANGRELQQLLLNKALEELKGPVNRNRWEIGPLVVNAYYEPSHNKVVFPVGILQYPFYDIDAPDEINLGAIGAVIGHELSHAIDNHGNNYTADGIFKEWVSGADRREFKLRTAYLVKRFNKIGHNGEFTLGENIADLVGLTAAYRAAFSGSDGHGELGREFFLQYARIWCEVEREHFTKLRLKNDPHALGWARANESLRQQRGFQEAYGCKIGDTMVAPVEERITIW